MMGDNIDIDISSQRSHSNDTTVPLNEDPMNLVETSWDISGTINNGNAAAAGSSSSNYITRPAAATNGSAAQQAASIIPIKN